ncbi:MAG: Gfo/Idh/MocA family oxidoreductase [Planctomycetes bacterium]|nr:Gfo/Idh/MocA family oxidoreductase [Planctomycetota bacterium]MCG2683466.1 Gfo/Idh/MocA family oxidoreductase [Planctomycetales bacterium]
MKPTPKIEPASAGVNRRDFILGTLATGAVVGGGLGAFYFGYEKSLGSPLRVGVIGAGDEGSVLIGAINSDYLEVRSIADIRPYSIWRAFHGDHYSDAALEARPGLLSKYGWKNETEARRHVKVYELEDGGYENLINNAKRDGVEAVIIALPLHLHAPAAIAAMRAGLHVMTEKLMAHSVHECKDMARVAKQTGMILATGHQRHYNILYANAVDSIRRGLLGDLHYIRAQWHRGNMPGRDSWQQPMPKKVKPKDHLANVLFDKRKEYRKELSSARGAAMDRCRARLEQVEAQLDDKIVEAEKFGYQSNQITDASGKVIYECPPIEELIRWRLWDRTGGGLMAELGSHQLDAASIFIAAMHGGEKQMPLSVAAAADRPLFPPDRDVEDHVYCLLEFPTPGYNADDPLARGNKIGVQYASINGNGFGGYGEMVFGTEGTLILEQEQNMLIAKDSDKTNGVQVTEAGAGPTLDTQATFGPTTATQAGGPVKVSRGYSEELEHWAWCIRHPDPYNQPRCGPKVALGDAVIALTTNIAARGGARIEFQKEWFDPDSDETPEGIAPSVRA